MKILPIMTAVLAVSIYATPILAKTERLLDRVAALEKVIENSIMASPRPCNTLGRGWRPYTKAKGRFLLGSGGNYPSQGGKSAVTLTTAHMPRHTHGYLSVGDGMRPAPGGWGLLQSGSWRNSVVVTGKSASKRRVSEEAGQSVTHENMPPYQTINFCKYTK